MTASDDLPEGVPGSVAPVADAVAGNWVDRWAPDRLRPYLRLSRADRPIGTWLLLLPCWWGLALAAGEDQWRLADLWIAAGCALGAWLMRGAGCTWNDITDREFDAAVARTRSRPIPSGQVTVKQALIWMFVQVALAGAIVLTFNWAAVVLAVSSLGLVVLYPFAKRFTWWPQLFLGLAFNWGVIVAFTAHSGWPAVSAWVLYLAGICWTLFYDTIYAHQDKEDDVLIGVKSTARLFGSATAKWLQNFLILTVILMSASIAIGMLLSAGFLKLAVAFAAPWLMGWHLFWQTQKLDINDSASCLRIFRSNRDTGLIAALFLAAAAFL